MAKPRPITAVHVDIARFIWEVSQVEDGALAGWTLRLAKSLATRDPSLHEYGAFLLAEVEDFRQADLERKRGRSKDSADSKVSIDSGLSNDSVDSVDSVERQPRSDQSKAKQSKKEELPPPLIPRVEPGDPIVLEILGSYPRTRITTGGGEERVSITEGDKKAVAAFLELNPGYPLLFAVQHYARSTRRPKDLRNWLADPPVLERVLNDQKRHAERTGAALAS